MKAKIKKLNQEKELYKSKITKSKDHDEAKQYHEKIMEINKELREIRKTIKHKNQINPYNVRKNTDTIYRIINKYKKDQRYKHIEFSMYKSKTTNSLYIVLKTIIDGKLIQRKRRISDHSKSGKRKGGEYLTQRLSEKDIDSLIRKFIKEIEELRLKKLLTTF